MSQAKARSGGRGRGQGPALAPVQKVEYLAEDCSTKKVTEVHSDMEFDEMCVDLEETLTGKELEYYRTCRKDLLEILMKFKGARVRDIRKFFTDRRGGRDLEWARLGLESWAHFLIVCRTYIDFKLEIKGDKEEQLHAFVNSVGCKVLGCETNETEKTINCANDPIYTNLSSLAPIKAGDAYVKGFMDAVEGRPKMDPRVPEQDPGSAADLMRRINTKKLTHAETMAVWKEKIKHPTIPTEALGPVSRTQNPSAAFECLDGFVAEEESPFPKPKWNC